MRPYNTGGGQPCARGGRTTALRGGADHRARGCARRCAQNNTQRTTPKEQHPQNDDRRPGKAGVVEISVEVNLGEFPAAWAKWLDYPAHQASDVYPGNPYGPTQEADTALARPPPRPNSKTASLTGGSQSVTQEEQMETESQMESPVMPTVAPMSPAPLFAQLREQWAAFSNHTQQAIEHIAKVSVRGLDAWSNTAFSCISDRHRERRRAPQDAAGNCRAYRPSFFGRDVVERRRAPRQAVQL